MASRSLAEWDSLLEGNRQQALSEIVGLQQSLEHEAEKARTAKQECQVMRAKLRRFDENAVDAMKEEIERMRGQLQAKNETIDAMIARMESGDAKAGGAAAKLFRDWATRMKVQQRDDEIADLRRESERMAAEIVQLRTAPAQGDAAMEELAEDQPSFEAFELDEKQAPEQRAGAHESDEDILAWMFESPHKVLALVKQLRVQGWRKKVEINAQSVRNDELLALCDGQARELADLYALLDGLAATAGRVQELESKLEESKREYRLLSEEHKEAKDKAKQTARASFLMQLRGAQNSDEGAASGRKMKEIKDGVRALHALFARVKAQNSNEAQEVKSELREISSAVIAEAREMIEQMLRERVDLESSLSERSLELTRLRRESSEMRDQLRLIKFAESGEATRLDWDELAGDLEASDFGDARAGDDFVEHEFLADERLIEMKRSLRRTIEANATKSVECFDSVDAKLAKFQERIEDVRYGMRRIQRTYHVAVSASIRSMIASRQREHERACANMESAISVLSKRVREIAIQAARMRRALGVDSEEGGGEMVPLAKIRSHIEAFIKYALALSAQAISQSLDERSAAIDRIADSVNILQREIAVRNKQTAALTERQASIRSELLGIIQASERRGQKSIHAHVDHASTITEIVECIAMLVK